MEGYQKRVIKEKKELDEKIVKLGAFIDKSPIKAAVPDAELARLCAQYFVMTGYSAILGNRIANFNE